MNIHLFAVGHLKNSPEKLLIETYKRRLSFCFKIKEVSCKKSLGPQELKEEEARLLLKEIPNDYGVISLDERGDLLTSLQFAQLLKFHQEKGTKNLAFCIGGASGFSPSIHKRSQHILSFGKLTWPHMLVRVLLIEQLYRAQQIMANHPYHRG